MNLANRKTVFDRWAPDYDWSVRDISQSDSFPFAGYDKVLDAMCREMEPTPWMSVLDLGTGTGNLARRIVDRGCRVWATDLSAAMLEKAREKVPEAVLIESDLLSTWPTDINGPFDRIVSAYVFHEFDLRSKISILCEAAKRLTSSGKIIIGDIGFSTRADFDSAQHRWQNSWDNSEYYWVADEVLEAQAAPASADSGPQYQSVPVNSSSSRHFMRRYAASFCNPLGRIRG